MASAVLSCVLAASVASTCTDCLERQQQIDSLSAEIVSLESQLFWVQYNLNSLNSQRSVAQQLISSLLATKPYNWESRVSSLLDMIVEIDSSISSAEGEQSDLQNQRDDAQSAIDSLADENDNCTVCN